MHYEKQEAGFSIDLDIDFTKSTQLAQPFFVSTVNQDGFTSGRLDGLEVDASGTVRANYTNGQNNPLGKIVLANFNNQNGLKQSVMQLTLKQRSLVQQQLVKRVQKVLEQFYLVH